jgi:hypothetical protein
LRSLHEVADLPNVIGDAASHRWRHAGGFVKAHEVVILEVQPDRSLEILQSLGKRIG